MKKLSFCLCLLLTVSAFSQDTEKLTASFLEKFNAGAYKEALPLALQAVKAAGKEFGINDANYAICCQNVGVTYYHLADYKPSNQWMHESNRAYAASAGTEELVEVHTAYHYIGNSHFGLANYDSSRAYFIAAYNYFLNYPDDQYENLMVAAEDLMAISFTTVSLEDIFTVATTLDSLVLAKEGAASLHYYNLLLNLANAYRQKASFPQAYEAYNRLEPLCVTLQGDTSLAYAELLQFKADCLRNMGIYKDCLPLLMKAYAIVKALPEEDIFSLANMHHNLANYYGEVAQGDLSFRHFDTTFYLLRQGQLTDNPLYGIALKSRAYTAIDLAMYAEAQLWLDSTTVWYNRLYPQGNPFAAELLVSRANTEYFTSQLDAADKHVTNALQLLQVNNDTSSYLYGRCYEIQALIAHGKGNSQEALQLCRQSIAHNNHLLGDSNLYSANSLSNMGIIYQDIGDYAKAEQVLRESFAIKWKVYNGQSHPQLAISLSNWAMVQVMQGRYKDADQLLAESVGIMRANNMLATPNGQAILNNVAMLSQKQGDYQSAITLYRQVLNAAQSGPNANKSLYAIATANLSTMMLADNNNDSALYYAKQTMRAAENEMGTSSLLYLKSANNALVALGRLKKYTEGRTLATELIPVIKKSLGDSSELMAITLGNLASLETMAGNFSVAAKWQQQSLAIHLHHYQLNLYALSERDQVAWWTQRSSLFQLQPALLAAVKNPDDELVQQMINQQLQLKGFVLYNARGAMQQIRVKGDAKMQVLLDKWQFLRSLYLAESVKPVAARRYNTDSLQYLANVAEQSLNTVAGNLMQRNEAVSWQQVQQHLAADEVAVEYIRYPIIVDNWYSDTMQYAAIVIQSKGKPALVQLGSEAAINWCLAGGKADDRNVQINKLYRTKIGKVNTGSFTGDSLYRLIWQPLEDLLAEAKTVHIAPEGTLHKVAFAALPLPNDAVLLDKWQIRQYASVRQLAEQPEQRPGITKALIAGHADFSGGQPDAVNTYWNDLPGTAKEIEAIAGFFAAKKIAVEKFAGNNASETSIRQTTSPSPDIIHIATHGFFLASPDTKADATLVVNADPAVLSSFADPLMRSGIVLAGANRFWAGRVPAIGQDDGILTAFEIAQMDWHNTTVVTLSACETGLGEVQDGEGVFGLKRAIKLAGARYTLVSLWQVPDAETAELMSLFYESMLQGNAVRDAFFAAQTAMRKKYKPFAWAAFVLSE